MNDKDLKRYQLKETRIKNMMKWTEEDLAFYRSFYKDLCGSDEIPYWEEAKKRKEAQRIECLSEEEWMKESYKRFLKFMEEVKERYK